MYGKAQFNVLITLQVVVLGLQWHLMLSFQSITLPFSVKEERLALTEESVDC
jgi:hypothetical protein